MKYIEYEWVVWSVPNEEERKIAEKHMRDYFISDDYMDPDVNFDYTLKPDETADRHFDSGKDLAEYAFDLHVDRWSW